MKEVVIDGARLIQGDSLEVLQTLPDKSVHCVVTSPPYFNLRRYGEDANEIGGEQNSDNYIYALMSVFSEVYRVLRDDGIAWLNLGDTYGKKGNLLGIPWRVALTLQEYGWILRQDVIWSKPDPMPAPVTNRCVTSHEYIFLLVKRPGYYYDHVAVSTPSKSPGRVTITKEKSLSYAQAIANGKKPSGNGKLGARLVNPLVTNARSVWVMSSEDFPEAHFATYPPELPTRCIKAGTSRKGCCPSCGKCWKRIVDKTRYPTRPNKHSKIKGKRKEEIGNRDPLRHVTEMIILGWEPGCDCPKHDPVPCTVLDPFAGAFTTGLVCQRLNRNFIGIELYPDNIILGAKRLRQRGKMGSTRKKDPGLPGFDINF
jgi:DNA modification methylase